MWFRFWDTPNWRSPNTCLGHKYYSYLQKYKVIGLRDVCHSLMYHTFTLEVFCSIEHFIFFKSSCCSFISRGQGIENKHHFQQFEMNLRKNNTTRYIISIVCVTMFNFHFFFKAMNRNVQARNSSFLCICRNKHD